MNIRGLLLLIVFSIFNCWLTNGQGTLGTVTHSESAIPDVFEGGWSHFRICQDTNAHLKCADGQTLTIDYCWYGAPRDGPNGDTVPDSHCPYLEDQPNCKGVGANCMNYFTQQCIDKQECTVEISDLQMYANHGDLCPGAKKYLSLATKCVGSSTAPAPITPITPAPVTPVTPAPVTPVTPAPVTPAPVIPAPITSSTSPHKRRLMGTEYIPNGLETRFYLYFGDTFNDNSLLKDQASLDKIISAVGKTLNDLISDRDSKINYDELGSISDSGYIYNNNTKQAVGDKYKSIMKDAKLVPYLNIKFDSHSTDLLALKSYLLDDNNTEIINKQIESKLELSGTVFDDLDFKVYFVDANCD